MKVMTQDEVKKIMNRKIKRDARIIANALECFRMASEEQKHSCPKHTCPYNNNSSYGDWCCANSIMFEAVRKLKQQAEEIRMLKKKLKEIK